MIAQVVDTLSTSLAYLLTQVVPKASLQQLPHLQRLQTELDVHQMLKHEHIANFLGSCQDEKNVYMLLEPCSKFTTCSPCSPLALSRQATTVIFELLFSAYTDMHSEGRQGINDLVMHTAQTCMERAMYLLCPTPTTCVASCVPVAGITVYDIVKHHGILSEQQAAQAVLQVGITAAIPAACSIISYST